MNLGILDLGLLDKGIDPHVSLHQTVLQAQHADKLGFCRYWLAEHYDQNCAWTYALPLAGVLLASTRSIHIGTGGVLLRHHQPFRIACDAKFLNSMYPDRFELGLGRGGAEYPWSAALTTEEKNYNLKVEDLLAHLQYSNHAVQNVDPAPNALPLNGTSPRIWILASGQYSVQLAKRLCLPLCLSLFHSQDLPKNALKNKPLFLAVAGSCGESKEEAESQLKKEDLFFWPKIVGNGEECLQQANILCKKLGAKELLFAELVRDHNYRINSLALLAKAAAASRDQVSS